VVETTVARQTYPALFAIITSGIETAKPTTSMSNNSAHDGDADGEPITFLLLNWLTNTRRTGNCFIEGIMGFWIAVHYLLLDTQRFLR
jgi:hypothetical protein